MQNRHIPVNRDKMMPPAVGFGIRHVGAARLCLSVTYPSCDCVSMNKTIHPPHFTCIKYFALYSSIGSYRRAADTPAALFIAGYFCCCFGTLPRRVIPTYITIATLLSELSPISRMRLSDEPAHSQRQRAFASLSVFEAANKQESFRGASGRVIRVGTLDRISRCGNPKF